VELQPHLIVLDIGLPTLNGFEAARHEQPNGKGKKSKTAKITSWSIAPTLCAGSIVASRRRTASGRAPESTDEPPF
jgi:CheY-like chemotaxis protein